jgi:hypothetical protein
MADRVYRPSTPARRGDAPNAPPAFRHLNRFAVPLLHRYWAVVGCALLGTACSASSGRARIVPAGALEPWESPSAEAAACFPIERLPVTDRAIAERILLEFSDREGLYTLAGGLKPVSSDVRNLQLRIAPTLDTARLAELERLRVIAPALRCGELGVFVQVFSAVFPGRDSSLVRSASMVLYHRQSLRDAIARHASFFAHLGVTTSADPRDVVGAVENAPQADRWRGYGYLFGYPDDAVDFFVQAGVEGERSKEIVPRDFRRVETFTKFPERQGGPLVQSSFVYAVPKGAAESAADRALREAAAPRFARYLTLRAQFIKPDSSGAAALWRAWLFPR